MNNAGVPIVFAVLAIWAASVLYATPEPAEDPKPPAPAAANPPPLESLFVSSVAPVVVIVADLGSEYGRRWMSDSAPKLREKGWEVRSLDLEGSPEIRFYVRANGSWRIHNGHMSFNSLRMMLGN